MVLLKMMDLVFIFIIPMMAWTESEILQPLPVSPCVDKLHLRYKAVTIPIKSIQDILDHLPPLLIRGISGALVIEAVGTCNLVGCPYQRRVVIVK